MSGANYEKWGMGMGDLLGASGAFSGHADLVEAELELTRERIRLALARRAPNPDSELDRWPEALVRAEAHLARRVAVTRAAGTSLPILWLEERLGLEPAERRVIWVLLAHEMCAASRGLLRQINTENCAEPTTDTIRLVAFGPGNHPEASRLLASDGVLARRRLIERTDADANASDHRKAWKVARRIVALAYGDLSSDPELIGIAKVVVPGEAPVGIGGGGIEVDPECLPVVRAALEHGGDNRIVIVQGQRGTGRRSLLRVAAAASDRELLEVDLACLASNPARAESQLAALARDCRLFERVPLLCDLDVLVAPPVAIGEQPVAQPDRLEQLVLELDGLLVLATTSTVIPGNRLRSPQIIEPRPLTGLQRSRLWLRALPSIGPDEADLLATMYPIAPALIDAAAAVARAQLQGEAGAIDPRHIRIGLRATLDGRLAGLANRIEITQRWTALVLPPDQREAIDELIIRVRRRRVVYETWDLGAHMGRSVGISALFSGPPGTGKTMAAGLIANELATDLYQVDMSKIVSKWIGETEKNLAALFEAAEAGQVILLFDEADALFGKRTDVKSSNDRHANQETNYLLQRLESFRGICILTTNHDTAIDEAFRRRLSLHVDFPMPDITERVQLWRSMLRDTVPVQGKLDFAGLASRYEMSGGYIRNAVLRAAFFAADSTGAVTNHHLFRAAQLEYQAMGRISTGL